MHDSRAFLEPMAGCGQSGNRTVLNHPSRRVVFLGLSLLTVAPLLAGCSKLDNVCSEPAPLVFEERRVSPATIYVTNDVSSSYSLSLGPALELEKSLLRLIVRPGDWVFLGNVGEDAPFQPFWRQRVPEAPGPSLRPAPSRPEPAAADAATAIKKQYQRAEEKWRCGYRQWKEETIHRLEEWRAEQNRLTASFLEAMDKVLHEVGAARSTQQSRWCRAMWQAGMVLKNSPDAPKFLIVAGDWEEYSSGSTRNPESVTECHHVDLARVNVVPLAFPCEAFSTCTARQDTWRRILDKSGAALPAGFLPVGASGAESISVVIEALRR